MEPFEKRGFTQWNRNNPDSKRFQSLFEILSQEEKPNIEWLMKKTALGSKKALSDLKFRLHLKLLEYLRKLEEQYSPGKIWKHCLNAKIFARKGLLQEALREISKAKESALAQDELSILLWINTLEINIQAKISPWALEPRLSLWADHFETIEKQKTQAELSRYSIRLSRSRYTIGKAKTKEQREQYEKASEYLDKFDESKIVTGYQKFSYHYCRLIKANGLDLKPEVQALIVDDCLAPFAANRELINSQFSNFVDLHFLGLEFALQTKNWDNFERLLISVKSVKSLKSPVRNWKFTTLIWENFRSLFYGDLEEIQQREKDFQKYQKQYNLRRADLNRYFMILGISYAAEGKVSRALDFAAKGEELSNNGGTPLSKMEYKLLSAFLHHRAGNFQLLPYLVKAIRKELKRGIRVLPPVKILANGLNLTTKSRIPKKSVLEIQGEIYQYLLRTQFQPLPMSRILLVACASLFDKRPLKFLLGTNIKNLIQKSDKGKG